LKTKHYTVFAKKERRRILTNTLSWICLHPLALKTQAARARTSILVFLWRDPWIFKHVFPIKIIKSFTEEKTKVSIAADACSGSWQGRDIFAFTISSQGIEGFEAER